MNIIIVGLGNIGETLASELNEPFKKFVCIKSISSIPMNAGCAYSYTHLGTSTNTAEINTVTERAKRRSIHIKSPTENLNSARLLQ